jgi:hypothetical protein
MNKNLWLAIVAAVSSFTTAYFTADYKTEQQTANINAIKASAEQKISTVAASTAGPLADGQKLCRVLAGKTWRDGLIVPKNWPISLCSDYAKKSGGTGYQLGCIYTDGTNLGKEDGTLPFPNCGWQ